MRRQRARLIRDDDAFSRVEWLFHVVRRADDIFASMHSATQQAETNKMQRSSDKTAKKSKGSSRPSPASSHASSNPSPATSSTLPAYPAPLSSATLAPHSAAVRVGGARRSRGGKAVQHSRAMLRARQEEIAEAQRKIKEAHEAQRPRYVRGDVFEQDTVMNMQLKNAESNDMFARRDDLRAEHAFTSAELAAQETPDAREKRERELETRMKQLEDALPETVRSIDNLSAANRRGERKANDRFRGSLVDYIFKLQAEVDAAGAKEMKERCEQDWVNWLEMMYRRHQPFSDDHYQWFRRVCEGRLNEDPMGFKLLLLSKLKETKRLTEGECNKLGSEYTTIKTMYPQMRASVEHHQQRLATSSANADEKSDYVVGDAEFVGKEGAWRWWISRAKDGGEEETAREEGGEKRRMLVQDSDIAIPRTFVQLCLSLQFAAETSDYEEVKKDDEYELLCCFTRRETVSVDGAKEKSATSAKETGANANESTNATENKSANSIEKKIVKFMKTGSDCDCFEKSQVCDATIASWIANENAAPVTEIELLNRDAHIFMIDRVGKPVDRWTVECYNVDPNDPAWSRMISHSAPAPSTTLTKDATASTTLTTAQEANAENEK